MKLNTEEGLRTVLRKALAGREDAARTLLQDLVREPAAAPEHIHQYIFASALSRRLDPARSAEMNLYLRRFALPQITLFELLAQHLPTVSLSVAVSGELLARFLGGHEEVTLLDVGIGTGRQEAEVVRALGAQGRAPARLCVFAVEPDAASLAQAAENLAAAARDTGVELRFHPLNLVAEELRDEHWHRIGASGAPLVAHAAFALHHLRDRGDGYCARAGFFRSLRRLDPLAVVLCEPSADHQTHLVGERFENCWRHFGLTFELIDRAGIPPREAAALKTFFAREIEDIIGSPEEFRYERHESAPVWVERLRQAGFTPLADFGLGDHIRHDVIDVRQREGYVGLDYRGETLVAVICATGAEAPAAPIA